MDIGGGIEYSGTSQSSSPSSISASPFGSQNSANSPDITNTDIATGAVGSPGITGITGAEGATGTSDITEEMKDIENSLKLGKGEILVTSGEVCSIQRAKDLGIFDVSNYYKKNRGYDDVRTYNEAKDMVQNRNQSIMLCTDNGETAYPLCMDQYGPGFVRDPANPAICKTYDCPPYFEKAGMYCKKEPLLKDARIDKRSRCDERWYDWFLTPNYHLGNKYGVSNNVCYAPCPPSHLPNYGTDPVDGNGYGFFPKDDLSKCVPRALYFGGKYAEGSDYCPIAWIYRMSASPENIKRIIDSKFQQIAKENSGLTTEEFDKYRNADVLKKEIQFVVDTSASILDNVEPPKNAMELACSDKLNTMDNLIPAYEMCKAAMADEKGESQLILDEDPARNDKRKVILKQACNAVFCNPRNNALDVINQDPICFKAQPTITPETAKPGEEPIPEAPTYEKEKSFFYSSVKTFFYMVITPVFLILLYALIVKFLWPLFRHVWYKFLSLFTGRHYGEIEYQDAALEYNRLEVKKAKRAAAAAAATKP